MWDTFPLQERTRPLSFLHVHIMEASFPFTKSGPRSPAQTKQGQPALFTHKVTGPPSPFTKKRKALPLQSRKSTILGNKKGRPHSPLQKRKGHQPFYKVGKGTVLFCKKKRRKGHISVQKGWANPFFTDKDEHLPPLLITNRPPLRYGKGIRIPTPPIHKGKGRPLMPG